MKRPERQQLVRRRIGITGALGVAAIAVAMAFAIDALMTRTAARALEAHAEQEARAWAARLTAAAPASDAPASEPEVLKTSFYDAQGRPFPLGRAARRSAKALPASRPEVWTRLTQGTPAIARVGDSERPFSPARAADAFVRLPDRAAPGPAYAHLRLDLSEISADLRGILTRTALGLTALAAFGFAAPALGWLALRSRARAAEGEVRRAADEDALTGLLNHSALKASAKRLARDAQADGAPIAAIRVDMDGFASLNDEHGTEAGDEVLRQAARRLRARLRADDLVGRIGGDEFAAVLRLSKPEDLAHVLERLAQDLREVIRVNGQRIETSASLGGCVMAASETAPEVALRRADFARAEAQADGRGLCRSFDDGMETRFQRARRVERSIRDGLRAGRVTLAYQPLVDAAGRTVGFEALMRLSSEDGMEIPPADFIPVAENTGLIEELGAWALQEATRSAALWSAPLRVAVNLSALQFRHGDLIRTVSEALAQSGLPPERLELEVTESLLISDAEEAEKQFAQLREMGVSLALDDFGTGYSSLASLWRHSFHRLKLDRSFAQAIAEEPERGGAMIAAVSDLARRLGMKVTAEGVEMELQARAFAERGCDELQGYWFGAPMSDRAFHEVMHWRSEIGDSRLPSHSRRLPELASEDRQRSGAA